MPEICIRITHIQVGHVLGKDASTLKDIQERTGAKLDILETGPQVRITADDDAKVAAAKAEVKKIVARQEKPDYEGPKGMRLRKEANDLGCLRSKLFEEATKRREAGDHEGANKLVAKGKEAGMNMQARHREAAVAIAWYNNEAKGKGQNYFDMHGLRVEEAMEMLKVRMARLEEQPEGTMTELEVVPGAGHHSAPGAQKLKAATLEYIKSKGYVYDVVNAGTFLVKVPGRSEGVISKPEYGDKAPTKRDESKKAPARKSKTKSCCVCM
ncbi:KH domain/Domain of unknown function (DUF1771)/Smr domain containing protein, putative [Leishmania guyanensis]|uniref:Smr domain-containing protein n=1 Tax=Leishmania guyanensis TaxID=5670 RepID=A0A1E1J373_LEIGU|nr:hypothetical protein, conserved [Leishmania guyanensis]